jgi:DNA mismatch endonuclease (patch repair protein)
VTDRISRSHRSWNMSRIRGVNTKPELSVRSSLHRMGFRFRLHVKSLPGRPDIVLPKYRTVIFVHGCFWHRHPHCPYAYTPKSNTPFWETKLLRNVERDSQKVAQLLRLGWNVLTVWECQANNQSILAQIAQEIRKCTSRCA